MGSGVYEGWINQNFNDDCMDGTGFSSAQFDTDAGTLTSATIVAPPATGLLAF